MTAAGSGLLWKAAGGGTAFFGTID